MIKITKTLLSEWFNKFNKEFFNDELRKPNFVVSHNHGYFGQFRPRTWTIEISTYWIRSERDYANTLIHECCHVYVRQNYGRFAQSHGYEWKEIANRINEKMQGKYGHIQRCGGGQDKYVVRNANVEKFIVFTSYKGKLSIAKYRDDAYVAKLKRLHCVQSGTNMYYVVSDNVDMALFKFRKANAHSINWNNTTMSLDDIMSKCDIIKVELFTELQKAG